MTTDASRIAEHMPVIDSDGHTVGTVDRLDGDHIKLTKDDAGQHHWVPVSMVDRVDEHVHLNVDHNELPTRWLSQDPHQH